MVTAVSQLVIPAHAPHYENRGQLRSNVSPQRLDFRKIYSGCRKVPLDLLEVSAIRMFELDATMPGECLLQVYEAVDRAIEIIDELSQFAKTKECSNVQRQTIFALKNMILALLWSSRRDLFHGVWQHTSPGMAQRCWECSGTGDSVLFGERCSKCKGSGLWKSGAPSILVVFAIQSAHYATTWHLPKSVVDSVLGSVPFGDDLVSEGKWISSDLRKVPVSYLPVEYEDRRSYLVWFILKSQEEIERLHTSRRSKR